MKSLPALLDGIVVPQPETAEVEQNLCLGKGYDYPVIRREVIELGYVSHIQGRGDDAQELETIPGAKARRWVVEASYSWFNRFRKILVRFEKKAENYLALLHMAAAVIALRRARPASPRSRRNGTILG